MQVQEEDESQFRHKALSSITRRSETPAPDDRLDQIRHDAAENKRMAKCMGINNWMQHEDGKQEEEEEDEPMITAWVGNERMHIPADASSFGSGIFPANVWGAKHNSPIDRLSALITRKRKAQRTSIQPVPTLKFATPFTRNRKGGDNLQRNNRSSAT